MEAVSIASPTPEKVPSQFRDYLNNSIRDVHDREVVVWNSKNGAIDEHSPTSSRDRWVIPDMDWIFNSILEELKLVDKQFCRRNGYSKIIKRETTHFDAKDIGDGSRNFSVAPRGKENFWFMEVWLLTGEIFINVQTKENVFGRLSWGSSNNYEVIRKHQVVKILI